VVAQTLSAEIKGDLDIVISRKLGAPGQSELAIGAMAEDGEVYLNQTVLEELTVTEAYLEEEKARQMAEIKRRNLLVRRILPRTPLEGRTVVITDDGIATGATMQVALWAVRRANPRKLVVAIPVASEEAVSRLAREVDELVCLRVPPSFMAVGQFYVRFDQVTDNEVMDILRRESERRVSANLNPQAG
jgi:predicted phosphoribosyltransferase